MCGIAGLLRFDGQQVDREEIKIILHKIMHRGRDHDGIELPDSFIGLGHRRLSIIDLNDHASQPMFYANQRYCLTYNGEIYNYRQLRHFLQEKAYQFTTQSDSEIILAAFDYWGEDCVKHFNGMFAFAIWDKHQRSLFCARDQVGIKPFYYYKTDTFIAFASEAFALTHFSQKKLNDDAVLAYFMSMYVATEESIFKSIYKLAAGHTLTINAQGKTALKRFWFIENFDEIDAHTASVENLSFLIQQAIKRQLQSDVPVGGFLSGGIDSGLITALAAPEVKHYYTYSVGYEGMLNNELPYAKKIAERYHTKHTSIMITASDAMPYLNQALQQSSEPIADSAIVATFMLSKLAAQDGVKVLLNGTGGDEIFAGYTRYTGQLSLKRKILLSLPSVLLKTLAHLPLQQKLISRLKHIEWDMLFSTGGSFSLAQSLISPTNFQLFLKKMMNELALSINQKIPNLYQRMLFDLHHYLPNELLFLLDQMTMAHTI